MIRRYNAGEDVSPKDIINSLTRLALTLALRCSTKYKHKRDELRSVAFLELVESVHRFLKKDLSERDLNIGGYVSKNISLAMRRFLRTDSLIAVPSGSIDYLYKKGVFDALNVSVINGLSDDRTAESIQRSIMPSTIPRYTFACNQTPETDIREIMDSVLKTEEEKKIVELKLSGYNDREIAEQLGYSTGYIQKRRHELISMLKKELKGYENRI